MWCQIGIEISGVTLYKVYDCLITMLYVHLSLIQNNIECTLQWKNKIRKKRITDEQNQKDPEPHEDVLSEDSGK